ncbi:MAG: hypothetical protein JXM75_04150 [Chromatiaceae bacterium]|nr:hypothetical protein [Chromatiaceae bacterium]
MLGFLIDEQPPNVPLHSRLPDSWQAEDSVALADLAEEIYGYIGWPASKKKRERQAQIQVLRQKPSA